MLIKPLFDVSGRNFWAYQQTNFVKSNVGSSSCNSSTSTTSFLGSAPFLVGLAPDCLLGTGLLLGGIAGMADEILVGLSSKAGPLGVLPISAYLQNGAGDDVGIC